MTLARKGELMTSAATLSTSRNDTLDLSLIELSSRLTPVRKALDQEIINRALAAAMHSYDLSYRPYVHTVPPCGVSLVSDSGRVFNGVQFQNAAYPSSFDEVRVALANLIASGERSVAAIVIYGQKPTLKGTGIELLAEFSPHCAVITADTKGKVDWNIVKFPEDYVRGAHSTFAPRHRSDVVRIFGADALQEGRPLPLSKEELSPLLTVDLAAVYRQLPQHTRDNISSERFIIAAEIACITSANAYAPYSNYPVGAAAVLKSGNIYGACNYETQGLELGSCGERTALSRAAAGGEFLAGTQKFDERLSLLITYVPNALAAEPCGGCRQMILEAGVDFPVVALGTGASVTLCDSFTTGKVTKLKFEGDKVASSEDVTQGGFAPAFFGAKHLS